MSHDFLLALVAFAFVTTVTPGPNNLMLLASGVNFGLRRSLPHVAGVTLGVVFMVLALGAGLAEGVARLPQAGLALKVLSLCYMLWLAWKIATAAAPDAGEGGGRPLTFLQAAAFQWVNPKAWVMALTALGAYALGDRGAGVLAVASAFLLVGPPCNLLWVAAGGRLRRLVADPKARRRLNLALAALLLATLWPMLRG
jgi:threonine/homoserine/homoserine lactone efflux protein